MQELDSESLYTLLNSSQLFQSLKQHEAFDSKIHYKIKIWDAEKVVRESLEVITKFSSLSGLLDQKLSSFYGDYMLGENKNQRLVAMTEAMSQIISLQFHSLNNKEIKLICKMMNKYDRVRYAKAYIRIRKAITRLLLLPDTYHTQFTNKTLDINLWSTILTRACDKSYHYDKIMDKIKNKIVKHVEEDCKKRKAPIDYKFKINAFLFIKITIKEIFEQFEMINKSTKYNFVVVEKRSVTPNPYAGGFMKENHLEFSPIMNDTGTFLVDEDEIKTKKSLEAKRLEFKKKISEISQRRKIAKNNYCFIFSYVLIRLEEKSKYYSDSAQRCQKLMQPLVNRMQADESKIHLLTPMLKAAAELIKTKSKFYGSVLAEAKKTSWKLYIAQPQ